MIIHPLYAKIVIFFSISQINTYFFLVIIIETQYPKLIDRYVAKKASNPDGLLAHYALCIFNYALSIYLM